MVILNLLEMGQISCSQKDRLYRTTDPRDGTDVRDVHRGHVKVSSEVNHNDGPEGKGLKYPSGSLCKLLYLCEKVMRKNINSLHIDKINEHLLVQVLSQVDRLNIFPGLTKHALETSMGADNDYLILIRLVSKKYFTLRIKKILKDECVDRSSGNSIDRLRIFSGL